MNVDQRTCLRCGQPLPEGSSCSRRYCDACGKQWNIELTRERQRRKDKRQAEIVAERRDKADRAYCRTCVYHGSENYGNYLCDYLLLTGTRRGCKAGVGCERRRTA